MACLQHPKLLELFWTAFSLAVPRERRGGKGAGQNKHSVLHTGRSRNGKDAAPEHQRARTVPALGW